VVILWIPFLCLYPLTALIGIGVGFAAVPIFARTLPPNTDVPAALGVLIGAVAFYIMIRIEYRLSQSAGYRISRHAVRMVLLAIVAIPTIQMAAGAPVESTSTRYILSVVSNPRIMFSFLADAKNVAILLTVVIVIHFVLWKGERFRRFWHRRLSAIGMK
jgi:lipoprotein signal peptidase